MILPVKVKDIDPLSLADFVPEDLKSALDPTSDDFDPDAKALIDFVEAEIKRTFDKTTDLVELLRAEQVPEEFIDDLAFELAVRFASGDTVTQKRKRIQGAIEGHRNSGLFNEDVKPRIDLITGLDSDIFKVPASEQAGWVWLGNLGDDALEQQWGTWGGDTPDGDDSGMIWLGSGTEALLSGNIFIDLGGDISTPDAETIEKVAGELGADGQFAYLRVVLGFIVAGNFIPYLGGVID